MRRRRFLKQTTACGVGFCAAPFAAPASASLQGEHATEDPMRQLPRTDQPADPLDQFELIIDLSLIPILRHDEMRFMRLVAMVRRKQARRGNWMPALHIRDDRFSTRYQYAFLIRGRIVESGNLDPAPNRWSEKAPASLDQAVAALALHLDQTVGRFARELSLDPRNPDHYRLAKKTPARKPRPTAGDVVTN